MSARERTGQRSTGLRQPSSSDSGRRWSFELAGLPFTLRQVNSIALRIITNGRLRTAIAAFQLERTEEHVVLAVPVGSPGFSRHGTKGGPRGSFLLPDRWDPGLHPRPWRDRDVVMVHRFADEWSTWRWLDEHGSWTAGAYVNIERLWAIGPAWYDTEDLTLDVVVSDDGALRLKDEDELAWAEQERIYTPQEAAHIRAVGDRAIEHFVVGGWPLEADWDQWRWPAGVGLPRLPAGWDDLAFPDPERRARP
jgi:hypothetical protein